jgi:hypothetical protein
MTSHSRRPISQGIRKLLWCPCTYSYFSRFCMERLRTSKDIHGYLVEFRIACIYPYINTPRIPTGKNHDHLATRSWQNRAIFKTRSTKYSGLRRFSNNSKHQPVFLWEGNHVTNMTHVCSRPAKFCSRRSLTVQKVLIDLPQSKHTENA